MLRGTVASVLVVALGLLAPLPADAQSHTKSHSSSPSTPHGTTGAHSKASSTKHAPAGSHATASSPSISDDKSPDNTKEPATPKDVQAPGKHTSGQGQK